MRAPNKRRVCSFDMAEVPSGGYVLADAEGEMYFCNSRCLCLWSVNSPNVHINADHSHYAPVDADCTSGCFQISCL